MTNKSISLIKSLEGKNIFEKEQILSEVIAIEFNRIKAQAKLFEKNSNMSDKLVEGVIKAENKDELFIYLKNLSVVEISLLTSYGLDVNFMNILKVSE